MSELIYDDLIKATTTDIVNLKNNTNTKIQLINANYTSAINILLDKINNQNTKLDNAIKNLESEIKNINKVIDDEVSNSNDWLKKVNNLK
jgi:gas vesicle protein